MLSKSPPKTDKRWLAVYVKMHHEKRVRDRLTDLGIENFLPVQIEVRQWSDRKKRVERLLIPMMIFVRVDMVEQHTVLTQPSVLRYLVLRGGEHSPTEIPKEQMDRFRFMLDCSDSPVSFNTNTLKPGGNGACHQGPPLAGLEGELVTVNGRSNIAIRINQLGCAVVEMSASMVENNKSLQ